MIWRWDDSEFSQVVFISTFPNRFISKFNWPRSTMDSIRVSEAPDPGSIPGEATNKNAAQKSSIFISILFVCIDSQRITLWQLKLLSLLSVNFALPYRYVYDD